MEVGEARVVSVTDLTQSRIVDQSAGSHPCMRDPPSPPPFCRLSLQRPSTDTDPRRSLLPLNTQYLISSVNDASSLLSASFTGRGYGRSRRTGIEAADGNSEPCRRSCRLFNPGWECWEWRKWNVEGNGIDYPPFPHLSLPSFGALSHIPELLGFSNFKTSLHRLRRCTG